MGAQRLSDQNQRQPFVVIVEDDPATAEMYGMGLDAQGFRVATYPDGSGLFQALDTEIPDIVVLDWRLSGLLTAADIIDNLRLDERTERLPILMLSNTDLDGARDYALRAGAQAWLTKANTSPDALARKLRSTLHSSPDGSTTRA
jgi:DNA-binding response OmpR family regulator